MKDPNMNNTSQHTWLLEDTTANNGKGSLTIDGVEHIATHKYKAGHSTHLDNLLNPTWNYLTTLLPLNLAPNMVTTLGGLHCFVSYMILWYYSPNFDMICPSWAVALSGYCIIAYYTLDCMDGKQARRTQTSSPLGQLFDHGFDCLCTISHFSVSSGYIHLGRSPVYLLTVQGLTQFAFFMAQWEEYHTEVLPHAMGNWFGVTEVNYGIGLFTICNAFIDRETFWNGLVKDSILGPYVKRLFVFITMGDSPFVQHIENLEFGQLAIILFCSTLLILLLGSIYRVCTHENVRKYKSYGTAISKLMTPTLLVFIPHVLPSSVQEAQLRRISIALGLLFCFLTKKMICFSMAKMTYASIQLESLPLIFAFLWIKFDSKIQSDGVAYLLGGLCLWNVYRLLTWAQVTIDQICTRLDIYCFVIKKKKEESKVKAT